MSKTFQIILNAIPILLMIGLIPFIKNDYLLTGTYCLIIIISLYIKMWKNDLLIFIFGFMIMILSESFFISTGVETFNRISLLGIMPLWLPFLWAYSFVAIRRGVAILLT